MDKVQKHNSFNTITLSIILLEKLTVTQLITKLTDIYTTQMFMTAFT